ncbi:SPRY domain-containing SOCS box protein 3-like [Diadema setosum]|uniref:SPRY domain-containing SOCS box protein 3-like n=1 Tax=Diadema antillarum TaxID=105358 RepID=UPI003A89761D
MASCPFPNSCRDNWGWNPNDKSHEVCLSGRRNETALFHPNWSIGAAGVRGTRPFLRGHRYYWEVAVSPRVYGTSMMVGVGSRKARLHVDSFVNLLGEDRESWGLSHKGTIWHGGNSVVFTSPFSEDAPTIVGILFDGPKGTLTFYKDRLLLGEAFKGINELEDELYPIVCSTAAKTEMSLVQTRRTFTSLFDRCRDIISSCVAEMDRVHTLPLPKALKRCIMDSM